MKCVVRALIDKDNQREIVYEKRCYSFYEYHIAIEEAYIAITGKGGVVIVTEVT